MKIENEQNGLNIETEATKKRNSELSLEKQREVSGGISPIDDGDNEYAKAHTSCPRCQAKGAENFEIAAAGGNFYIFRCKVCGCKYQD